MFFHDFLKLCFLLFLIIKFRAQITNTNFLWLEDSELDRSSMKMKSLSVDRRSRSPPLRTISRIPEAISPQPPHRSSFLKVFLILC